MNTKELEPTSVIWHESSKLNQGSTKTLLIEYYPSYQRDYTAFATAVIDRGALLVEGSWVHFDHLIRFAELDLDGVQGVLGTYQK